MNRDENQKRLARIAPEAVVVIRYGTPGLTLEKLLAAKAFMERAQEEYDDGYLNDDPA